MKIAIDVRHGVSQYKTGIAWYTFNLLHSLSAIDKTNYYTLYDFRSHNFRKEYERLISILPQQSNFRVKIVRIHSGIARRYLSRLLPIEMCIGRNDLVHIPHPDMVKTYRARKIVTVHDMIHIIPESSEWLPAASRIRRAKTIRISLLQSDKIITVSQYTKGDILLTGYVPIDDLPVLYNSAYIFMYPSLYEGFGIPILETMASGCPVITSNVSSMPEVAGDAAVLVNPYSVEEISAAIEKVLSDEQFRMGLIEKGLVRAKQFSWEKTVRETLQVYREVYEKR
jgi:hypothetical protein